MPYSLTTETANTEFLHLLGRSDSVFDISYLNGRLSRPSPAPCCTKATSQGRLHLFFQECPPAPDKHSLTVHSKCCVFSLHTPTRERGVCVFSYHPRRSSNTKLRSNTFPFLTPTHSSPLAAPPGMVLRIESVAVNTDVTRRTVCFVSFQLNSFAFSVPTIILSASRTINSILVVTSAIVVKTIPLVPVVLGGVTSANMMFV